MKEARKIFPAFSVPLFFSILTLIIYQRFFAKEESTISFSICNPCIYNNSVFTGDYESLMGFVLLFFSASLFLLSFILPFWISNDKKTIERTEIDLTY